MYGFSAKSGQPLTNGKFNYSLIDDQQTLETIIPTIKDDLFYHKIYVKKVNPKQGSVIKITIPIDKLIR